jgi:hypothetical protein
MTTVLERLTKANNLLGLIAMTDDHRFSLSKQSLRFGPYSVAWLSRGRYNWPHGGMMLTLIIALGKWIQRGHSFNLSLFGPWPEWFSMSDPWGVGAERMDEIREAAKNLLTTKNND